MKNLWRYIFRNWVFSLTVFIFLLLITLWIKNPHNIVGYFFDGKEWGSCTECAKTAKTPAEILTYIGVCCGSILLLGSQWTANRRNLIADKRNVITEKGNLDIRFKDAALLLANDNTSAIVSGIYALHQVAVEASKGDKNQQGYVKIVQDILCAFIRENNEYEKDKEDNIIVEKIERTKPKIVFQTIMDVLNDKEHPIYTSSEMDFSNSDLSGMQLEEYNFFWAYLTGANLTGADLGDADLTRVDLRGANLTGADLEDTNLTRVYLVGAKLFNAKLFNADLTGAHLMDANLTEANLTGADLIRANLAGADLTGADLEEVNLTGANLISANLTSANLTGADLTKAYLRDTDFSNAKINEHTNFTGTKLEGVPIEEIVGPGRSLELTKWG